MLSVSHQGRAWNYLRVRGEYRNICRKHSWRWELPPRARRIPSGATVSPHVSRTTSACAENTQPWRLVQGVYWNYLRVRGEYINPDMDDPNPPELPPRARRIHGYPSFRFRRQGTTSACAENTQPTGGPRHDQWNYLRVRGEYRFVLCWTGTQAELPPRARRILFAVIVKLVIVGTTSACAENTLLRSLKLLRARNYLRVRGEYHPPQHIHPQT